jgi:hypothetical protein
LGSASLTVCQIMYCGFTAVRKDHFYIRVFVISHKTHTCRIII